MSFRSTTTSRDTWGQSGAHGATGAGGFHGSTKLMGSGAAGKRLLATQHAKLHRAAVALCAQLSREGAPGRAAQALEIADESKTQNLADLLAERQPGPDVPHEARDEWQRLRGELWQQATRPSRR